MITGAVRSQRAARTEGLAGMMFTGDDCTIAKFVIIGMVSFMVLGLVHIALMPWIYRK